MNTESLSQTVSLKTFNECDDHLLLWNVAPEAFLHPQTVIYQDDVAVTRARCKLCMMIFPVLVDL